MNRRRYRFHPGDYELGENEKFYSDMEAQGWRLVSRGAFLSRFAPAEPSAARYRVEVAEENYYAYLSDEDMDDGRLAVFADCGWEFVTGRRLLRIFRAPAGSGAPEFYMDPRQQAATLKTLHRQHLIGWIPTLFTLLFSLFLQSRRLGGLAYFHRAWVEETALCLLLLAAVAWLAYVNLHAAWHVGRVIRRMKRGQPLDHSPRSRRHVHRAVCWGLAGAMALCGILAAAQRMEARAGELPLLTTEPYLLPGELGLPGEWTLKEGSVTRSQSLLADCWDVYEEMSAQGNTAWIWQDVYLLGTERAAVGMAQSLMGTATFGDQGRSFRAIDPGGLDMAWAAGELELVAVKGRLAAHITYIGDGFWDPAAICGALEEKWAG